MTPPLVVILAGGEGRRIGGGKPLRPLGEGRLIDRAARIALGWSDDVRLAVRTPEQTSGAGLPLLLDEPGAAGPLAGLRSGLEAARRARRGFVLTVPCDVPFLPDDLLSKLLEVIGDRLAALAASGADLHPACALWRVDALDHLPAYLESGRRSLIGFAETIGFARAHWDASHFLNVNSPADLAEAERRLASEVQDVDRHPRLDGGALRR